MNHLKSLRSIFSFPQAGWLLLLVTWVLVEAYTYMRYGIVLSSDSEFYLDNSRLILDGKIPEDRGIWYYSYSLVIAFIFSCGGSIATVILIQYLLSGIAAIALYKVVNHMFQNDFIAFLSVLQYLLWVKIHQWNSSLYTESLFTSFSIISFAMLVMSNKKSEYILTALLLIFTFFLRPTGSCLFVATTAFFIFKVVLKKIFSTKALAMFILCVVILTIGLLNTMLSEYIYFFIDSYSKAEIIYPNINLGVKASSNLKIPAENHAPLVQLVEFIVYNPLYFAKLFFIKFFLFIGNVKPYFTWLHNLYIVCFLYPIYLFAVYGYKKIVWAPEHAWTITFILLQTLTVSLTSENWDGRFLNLILPFVFIYASYGIYQFKNNIIKK